MRGGDFIAAISFIGLTGACLYAEPFGDVPARGFFPPSRADDLPRSLPYGSGALVECDGFITVLPCFHNSGE